MYGYAPDYIPCSLAPFGGMQAYADAQALPSVLHERPGHLILSHEYTTSADAIELVLLRSEPPSATESAGAEALLPEAGINGTQPHAQPAAVAQPAAAAAVHGEAGEEGQSSSGAPSSAAGEEPDQDVLEERRQRSLAGQPGTRDSSSSLSGDMASGLSAAHGQKEAQKQSRNGHAHASRMPLQIKLESSAGTAYHSSPHTRVALLQQKPGRGAMATRFAALPWAQVGAFCSPWQHHTVAFCLTPVQRRTMAFIFRLAAKCCRVLTGAQLASVIRICWPGCRLHAASESPAGWPGGSAGLCQGLPRREPPSLSLLCPSPVLQPSRLHPSNLYPDSLVLLPCTLASELALGLHGAGERG